MAVIVQRTKITDAFALEQHPMWAVRTINASLQINKDQIAGSEAFGRYTAIPPGRNLDDFFRIMEINHPKAAFNHDLGVCEAAAWKISQINSEGDQVHTFNVSLATLMFKDSADKIISVLSRYGSSHLFTIEVTEPRSEVSDKNFRLIAENVRKLSQYGCRLLFDDFAPNDPRLAYLAPYVHGFKTDKDHTSRILSGQDSLSGTDFVRSIQNRSDGIIVFEGVKSVQDAIRLHQKFAGSAMTLNQGHHLVSERRSRTRAENDSRYTPL